MVSTISRIKYVAYLVFIVAMIQYLAIIAISKDLYIDNYFYYQYQLQLLLSFLIPLVAVILGLGLRERYASAYAFTLMSIYSIVSSFNAWGTIPLGHEDYGRDVRWATQMMQQGFWRSYSLSTVYSLFPSHSFVLYILDAIAFSNIPIYTIGLIVRIALALAVSIATSQLFEQFMTYLDLDNGSLARALFSPIHALIVLSVFTFIVPSAQMYSIILLLLITEELFRVVKFEGRIESTSNIILFVSMVLGLVAYHISPSFLLILLSITILVYKILARHPAENYSSSLYLLSYIFILIPVSWYLLNEGIYAQTSGFLSTFFKALIREINVEQLSFVATLQFYTSPLWLIRYYSLVLSPIYVSLSIIHILDTQRKKRRRGELLVLLESALLMQLLVALFFTIITHNSTYYRYLATPVEYIIAVLTVVLSFNTLSRGRNKSVLLASFVTFFTVSTMITLMHHTSAPLLHLDMDLVPDTISKQLIDTVTRLLDQTYTSSTFTINLPYGINPYGTNDYWIIRYNIIERKYIPTPITIFIDETKKPLNYFLYEYFLAENDTNMEVNLVLSSNRCFIVELP